MLMLLGNKKDVGNEESIDGERNTLCVKRLIVEIVRRDGDRRYDWEGTRLV